MYNGSHANKNASSDGSWYSFNTANAGTGTASATATSGINLQYNICSRNWSLPTSTQQSNIINLGAYYTMLYSGKYIVDGLTYSGTSGYWWSRTVINDASYQAAYCLYTEKPYTGLKFSWHSRYAGFSLRCVAK